MAELKQKSMDLPLFIQRQVPLWSAPQWLNAERWRRLVYNQPVLAVCQDALISDVIASEWQIRPRDAKMEDKLAPEIEHYTRVFNPDMGSGIRGFDPWVTRGLQDFLTLPVGWNNELVRWPVNGGPFSSPHHKGHVDKIVFIDGATLAPTYDPNLIMVQRIKQDMTRTVYFEDREIGRLIWSPRVELELSGYGMAPPERVYLAVEALYRGDKYYANLLLDTPEAGLLDLLDIDLEDMEKWSKSQRELMTGVDPFKITILYDHDKPAQFIPFGRPPTDILFNELSLKYAQFVHSGYGLTLTDTGLGDPQKTLAGSIRDERRSQRSGYSRTREAIKTFADEEVLPPDLEFVWVIMDEERRVQAGRSFVLFSQTLKNLKDAGIINAEIGQSVLKREGFLNEDTELPEEQPPAPNTFGGANLVSNEIDKVPAQEGGRGDIVAKGPALGDPSIASVPTQAPTFDQLAIIMRNGFDGVLNEASNARMLRLVKKATRLLYPQTQKALIRLSQVDYPDYLEQRNLMWLEQESAFDEFPDVIKASQDVLDELDKQLDDDKWWELPAKIAASIAVVLQAAYSQGATLAAQQAWEFLYTEGIVNTPSIAGFNFTLSNPATIEQLEAKAAQLVTRVNDGTKFYLKRVITSGVEEGLSTPNIAQMVKDGVDVETVLREAGYSEQTINRAKMELEQMTDSRVNSIANTEIARAETDGRLGQWGQMGLTRKRWNHTGPDTPCPICQGNINLGFVEMDYMYDSVFGDADTPGPPAHPQVDHCHIEFDEEELMGRGDELQLWDGS